MLELLLIPMKRHCLEIQQSTGDNLPKYLSIHKFSLARHTKNLFLAILLHYISVDGKQDKALKLCMKTIWYASIIFFSNLIKQWCTWSKYKDLCDSTIQKRFEFISNSCYKSLYVSMYIYMILYLRTIKNPRI